MDFPLPIRSFTSSTDFSMPLFVETNIVYNIDETKFPGLHERLHSSEAALIIDSNISLNSCNTLNGRSETCDGENQDLYNIIDSWFVQDVVFPSVDDILDLPDIQKELLKFDAPVNEMNQVIVPSACVIGDSTHLLTSNVTETQIDTTVSPLCESWGFSTPLKRKRKVLFSLHEYITNYNCIEDLVCPKRRKSETSEFNSINYSLDNCFENVIDYIFPQRPIYPGENETAMFHFGLSPIKSLSDRQW